MLLALLLQLASVDAAQACAPSTGWTDGRRGRPAAAACAAVEDYAEAHRLGDALHALDAELNALAAYMESLK